MLHIEQGRNTELKTPLNERLCYSCHCIADELHLVTACSINVVERILFSKVADKYPGFDNLDDVGKFVFWLTFEDAQMLTWLGKFLVQILCNQSITIEWNVHMIRAYELYLRRPCCHPRCRRLSTRQLSAPLVPTRPQWRRPVYFDVANQWASFINAGAPSGPSRTSGGPEQAT